MQSRLTYLPLALVAAVTCVSAAQHDAARTMLEAARKAEVVDGNLNGAIQQYRAIADKYKSDRAIVADALLRMAECYQKLGDAQARKIFEQVVRDYADQQEAVTMLFLLVLFLFLTMAAISRLRAGPVIFTCTI